MKALCVERFVLQKNKGPKEKKKIYRIWRPCWLGEWTERVCVASNHAIELCSFHGPKTKERIIILIMFDFI